MIHIDVKENCCGCNGCVQCCPKQCITMHTDEEGFWYPTVDINICINCGLCERVCPVLNQNEPQKPLHTYAAKNKNKEIQLQSSSGGMFSLIAEYIIKQNGIVFGAKFNEKWEVIHSYTDTIEGLKEFRGSKYLQSQIGNTYIKAKEFLIQGKYVLFSGVPCQIAGLHKFLGKTYEKLLTIDIICHGVPSPKVWNMYLKSYYPNINIQKFYFRNKDNGWTNYNIKIHGVLPPKNTKEIIITESARRNIYMKGFLSNLYLRPSCYACPTKQFKSGSDIMLGDFWGIEHTIPEFYDENGISAVFTLSAKGNKIIESIDSDKTETDDEKVVTHNISINKSVNYDSKNRNIFYKHLENKGYKKAMRKILYKSKIIRICNRLRIYK